MLPYNDSPSLEENPLLVPPKLAALIGLKEAILLQQIHYWTWKGSGKLTNNERWIWNSLDKWLMQLPFLSKWELRQAFSRLRQLGLIKFAQHKKHQWDREGSYAIDYERLKALQLSKCENPHVEVLDPTRRCVGYHTSKCEEPHVDVWTAHTSNGTKTTPETTSEISLSPPNPSQEKERERGEQKYLEQEEANQGNTIRAESMNEPRPPASLGDKSKIWIQTIDLQKDQSSGAALQNNSDVVWREWEAAPGEPYPNFVQWRSQHYIEQGGHWAKAATANARSEIRNNPQRASDLWQQFLEYSNRAADNALAARNAGISPSLPPCFQEEAAPTKEEVAAKLQAATTPNAIAPAANIPEDGQNSDAYCPFQPPAIEANSAPAENFKTQMQALINRRSMSKLELEREPEPIFSMQPSLVEVRELWAAGDLELRVKIREEILANPHWDLEFVNGCIQEIQF